MNDLDSLYIERNNCGDCYRCVRECVVKAIKFHEGQAAIIPDMCVECGNCVGVCPVDVVRVRDDVWLARSFVKKHTVKVASLAPTWMTEFPGVDPCRMVEALKLLGFTHVSETSLGAEKVTEQEIGLLKERKGLSISSRCPAVNDYIRKYRPQLTSCILPVESPMVAHARMIKSWWGHDAQVVHISSCIAAKGEAMQYPDQLELVLTFRELKRWMHDEGVDFDLIPGHDGYQFEPFTPKKGLLYGVVRGGINAGELRKHNLNDYTYLGKSSAVEVDRLLNQIPAKIEDNIYLDLMMCYNGCIGSCGSTENQTSLLEKQVNLHKALERRQKIDESYTLPYVNMQRDPFVATPINTTFVAEAETLKALESIGIHTELQLINCNGCGYGTCRRFAKALSRGVVEREMCTYYVRKGLQDKFETLLDKLSSGVMVVDDSMRVVEANRHIAAMLGPDALQAYDTTPLLRGVEVDRVAPFHALCRTLLESGDEMLLRDIQVKDRMLNVSVYTIQKHKLLLVILRNMLFSQVRNEEIVERTQKVIRANLDTVQKIAYLLGENASRTEAVLNSILDAQVAENADG